MQFIPLSADVLADALQHQSIGKHIIYQHVMPSTMDVAQAAIKSDAPHGTVVVCEQQEHGQGRLSRQWFSPLGGVYLSVILYLPQSFLSRLTVWASLATADAIREVCELDVHFKWPNDVLLNGKKVSGIMARSGQDACGRLWAVVGIGINANLILTEQPAEIASISAFLSEVKDHEVSRNHLIISLLKHCEQRYDALMRGETFIDEWRLKLVTLGKFVVVKNGTNVYEGLAEMVDDDGALLLREPEGKLVKVPAGDVTLR